MQDNVNRWLDQAFESVEAPLASAAIARHRLQFEDALGVPVRSYEVVVKPGETLLALVERVHPRFAYHMEGLGLPREGCAEVFFSVFAGDRLHFLDSAVSMRFFEEVLRAARPPLMLPAR